MISELSKYIFKDNYGIGQSKIDAIKDVENIFNCYNKKDYNDIELKISQIAQLTVDVFNKKKELDKLNFIITNIKCSEIVNDKIKKDIDYIEESIKKSQSLIGEKFEVISKLKKQISKREFNYDKKILEINEKDNDIFLANIEIKKLNEILLTL